MRLAELVATFAIAADAGMGMPMDHGLRSAAVAVRLGELAGASEAERADAFYLALLRYVGCTSDSDVAADVMGDEVAVRGGLYGVDWGAPAEMLSRMARTVGAGKSVRGTVRFVRTVSKLPRLMNGAIAHCEVGDRLAEGLGFAASFRAALFQTFERWDGKGFPRRLAREAIALPMRLAHVAEDLEIGHREGGVDGALALVRKRRGRGLDPGLVDRAGAHAAEVCAPLAEGSPWNAALAAEPGPPRDLSDEQLDEGLRVLGDFADLKSRFTRSHARGVARLARAAAARLGLGEPTERLLERAGLVHDLGRVAVSAGVWDKPGPLSDPEWERVRMHTYVGERILARASGLAAIAEVATQAHERLDASGYHRKLGAAACTTPARLLAAADVYQALVEERAYRPAYPPAEAAAELALMARAGTLCPDAVAAVLEAAGVAAPRAARPSGLTDRELEVLRLCARGLTNKEIGAALDIAGKTAGRHLEHIFAKLGVTTRAAATLFAMRQGLLD